MNINKWTLIPESIPRWLIATGLAVGLMVPLSASADHEGNGAVEILVSAAIAYAVVDAVGGFDDDGKRDRRHRRDRYRDGRHDRDYRSWDDGRRYHARNDQRRHDRHGHRNKHRGYHAKHRNAHRYASGQDHRRRDDRRYRYWAHN